MKRGYTESPSTSLGPPQSRIKHNPDGYSKCMERRLCGTNEIESIYSKRNIQIKQSNGFEIAGTLQAPSKANGFQEGQGWITFEKINQLTIYGGGTFDGNVGDNLLRSTITKLQCKIPVQPKTELEAFGTKAEETGRCELTSSATGIAMPHTAIDVQICSSAGDLCWKLYASVEYISFLVNACREGKLYLLLLGTTALSLVTTPLLFKLISAFVHLGVLLRWFSPDSPSEVKERTANANDFVNGGSHVMEYGSRSIRAEKLYLYQKFVVRT
ncbi:hypothetical protein G4B88_029204 [Cannabis sativa]|uniref:Uncharacterized protein n=1 Tax=Cannabis sativa TaxID=3483 RepID=A0A7J6H122_CANSA|nr:hypothetical protein G4B88_029204 [Cannabis sativa]